MRPHQEGSSRSGLHARLLNEIGLSIVRGDLVPGDQLPNGDDWSAAVGASRTGLREVVKVLAGKGMVEMRPRTGTRVRPRKDWNFLDPDVLLWRFGARTTVEDARSLFELRRAIEPMAGALAAERATPGQIAELRDILAEMEAAGADSERFAVPDLAFHQAILHMSGNELIGSLSALIETALVISFRLTDDNPAGQLHSLGLHQQIVEFIEKRDPAATSRALIALLDGAEADVRVSLAARQGRQA
ncbi:GntR family transcriptional regulator [Kaistia sp. 32K]|uniref:FadR/GntR family transcriptional regulator n=1 Tax=Kaistia sp. 32K TaxID=2795690 RepID=UPI0019379BA6|nr:FadR/GntR family transcriptional regulator [Kaistia sp. 32K]BCP52989.1 GntR family transcriptional regulator [Kaistia sp. 32K]